MIRWILTAIALLLLLRLVLRFVLGLLQGLAPPSGASAPGRAGSGRAKIAGELVRDPVCSTYIPRESAIMVRVGGETRYYCSTACRDKDADAGRTPRVGRAAHG
jgi:YHS domain-containing protein